MIDNREISTVVWLAALLIGIVAFPNTRQSIGSVVRAALHPQIVVIAILLAGWVALLALAGSQISLWNPSLTKATVIWCVSTGLVMMFHAGVSRTPGELTRRIGLSTLVFSFVLAFYLNFHVFNLALELLLQPVMAFFGILAVAAGVRPEYAHVEVFAKRVTGVIGISIMAYATARWLQGWQVTEWDAVALQLALPFWLSLGLLPFLFALHVFSTYQRVTKMITHFDRSFSNHLRSISALILEIRLRTEPLASFPPYWARRMGEADGVRDKRRVLGEFLSMIEIREREDKEVQQKLDQFAGGDGVDEYGSQLDQREFEETRRALLGLASSQMGWYRNRGERYRPELLELMKSRFERDGLPAEHGITLNVSGDGQKWFAWRRTVTGWCFAIGAAGPPPDQRLYDGPYPPSGFPGEDPLWGNRRDEHAVNW